MSVVQNETGVAFHGHYFGILEYFLHVTWFVHLKSSSLFSASSVRLFCFCLDKHEHHPKWEGKDACPLPPPSRPLVRLVAVNACGQIDNDFAIDWLCQFVRQKVATRQLAVPRRCD